MPLERRRAGLHGGVDDLAGALDVVEPDLDAVARHEPARHAAAVRVVELLLES